MERRKQLVKQFQEIKIEAGVYQIKNKVNGKVYIASLPNLKSLSGKAMQLNMGSFTVKSLQADWTALGEDAFAIEVLEVLPPNDNPFVSVKDELKRLEKKWLDQLEPYDDRGYNTRKLERR